MATKHVKKRLTFKKESTSFLKAYLEYLRNPEHEDHVGKVLLSGKNYNCPSPDEAGFVVAVEKNDEAYQRYRSGKRGKRTKIKWDEVVYGCPYGANLTDLERAAAEAILVNKIARTTAARVTWHLDPKTGAADIHILIAAKTTGYPPKVTLRENFGRDGGDHIFAAFDRIDAEIAATINEHRPPEKQITNMAEARRQNASRALEALAAAIASKHRRPISPANLAATLQGLGYRPAKLVPPHHVKIRTGNGKKHTRAFELSKLSTAIELAQSRLRDRPKDNPEIH